MKETIVVVLLLIGLIALVVTSAKGFAQRREIWLTKWLIVVSRVILVLALLYLCVWLLAMVYETLFAEEGESLVPTLGQLIAGLIPCLVLGALGEVVAIIAGRRSGGTAATNDDDAELDSPKSSVVAERAVAPASVSAAAQPAPARPQYVLRHEMGADFVLRMRKLIEQLRACPLGLLDQGIDEKYVAAMRNEAAALEALGRDAGIDQLPQFGGGDFAGRVQRYAWFMGAVLSPRKRTSSAGLVGDIQALRIPDFFTVLAGEVASQIGAQYEPSLWHDERVVGSLASMPSFCAMVDRAYESKLLPEDRQDLLIMMDGHSVYYAKNFPHALRCVGARIAIIEAATRYAGEFSNKGGAFTAAMNELWDENESRLTPRPLVGALA